METLKVLSGLATPEVGIVFGGIVALYTGWRITKWTVTTAASMASKVSLLGLLASVLVLGGTTAGGLGMGELATRWSEKPEAAKKTGISDSTLTVLAQSCGNDKEALKLLLDYSRDRDGKTNDVGETQMIARLVEKSVNDGKADSDKALAAFIQYLNTTKQQGKTKGAVEVAINSNDPAAVMQMVSAGDENTSKPIQKRDSLVSIPTSMALIGLAFGSLLCGGATYLRYRKQPVGANVQQGGNKIG